jgi:hypothetical protein
MSSREYEEFVASLNAAEARYLIVGAHALAFHARPRATKDLDVWIDPGGDNPDVPAHYLNRDDLVHSKKAADRFIDTVPAELGGRYPQKAATFLQNPSAVPPEPSAPPSRAR